MGKLVLVRHGESIFNKENRFCGWIDITLSKKGVNEAKRAGDNLSNVKFDIAFTSKLIRAQRTLYEILDKNISNNKYIVEHESKNKWYSHMQKSKNDEGHLKIIEAEELNERYYGDLQGLNKEETIKEHGEKKVHQWRRSYKTAPPGGESLFDTYNRAVPYYQKVIEKILSEDKNVIICAHGNSLRSIIKYIENVSDKDISTIELGTAMPIVYEFDNHMKIKKKRTL